MTAAAVVYGIVVATVGGILAALAHRDLTRTRIRAELNAATLAHIKRQQDEAEDFSKWTREIGWVR